MLARAEVDFKGIICARLSSGEKRAGGAQDGLCHRINLILSHQAQRHSVSQIRVHARQPGLHDGGRIVLAQGTRHLKGKPQPALRAAVDRAAGDPAIDSANVLDAADTNRLPKMEANSRSISSSSA